MKKYIVITLVLMTGIVALFDPFSGKANILELNLELSSNDIVHDESIDLKHVFNGFGCVGQNKSPDLRWTHVPEGTKSFALTVFDPDAPTGSGWWHWLTYNIPADVNNLPQDAASHMHDINPKITQGRNDYGDYGYGGPCPPKGDKAHRYIFTLYALSTETLNIPKDASAALIGYNIKANTIEQTELTATYGR